MGLQGAAAAYTKLGDRETATTYLVQLSKAKPDDPQVFRLLVCSASKPLSCSAPGQLTAASAPSA